MLEALRVPIYPAEEARRKEAREREERRKIQEKAAIEAEKEWERAQDEERRKEEEELRKWQAELDRKQEQEQRLKDWYFTAAEITKSAPRTNPKTGVPMKEDIYRNMLKQVYSTSLFYFTPSHRQVGTILIYASLFPFWVHVVLG